VADKSSQIVMAALSQAAAHADGLPLHGGKAHPGLFPSTALGKQAAQRCRDEGYLHPLPEKAVADTPPKRKKPAPESWGLTEKGMAYLLNQVSPRHVLEDFVRALETRQAPLAELLAAAGAMQATLEALKANAEKVLHVFPASGNGSAPAESLNALFSQFLNETRKAAPADPAPSKEASPPCGDLLAPLARWQATCGAAEDCPLPELFRQVQAAAPSLTIGVFHDECRRRHDAGQIYLHPWTGPLYELPEPRYALLVGHEIAYYASLRT
jgi:hypothetical protein